MSETSETQTQAQTPPPETAWHQQLSLLANMCVGYAPSVARHDPTLGRQLTMAGLRLGWLLDKLDGYPPPRDAGGLYSAD
jgi:hypothetical protein